MALIEGTVESVVYNSDESGYAVLTVKAAGGLVTVVGCLPCAGEGELISAEGEFTTHYSYGSQFRAAHIERSLPSDVNAILKYLTAGSVKGVGPATARRLVSHFGAETLDIIAAEPHRLSEIRGITAKKAAEIGEAFNARNAMRTLMELLNRFSIDPSVAVGLFRTYGREAENRVLQDPYMLVTGGLVSDFTKVDALAYKNGFSSDSPRRLEAGLFYELWFNMQEGHVFLPREKLLAAASEMLSASEDKLCTALSALESAGSVVCEQIRDFDAVYLRDMYESETYVAQRVAFFVGRPLIRVRDTERLVGEIEKKLGICYAEKQRLAIRSAAECGIMILTGGPGTGKTTAVRGMLALFDELGLKYALGAPTGRAAKRMSELCGREAKTIHRLLEIGFADGELKFTRNVENPLEADVIVIDELSMVDVPLMASLLSAVKNGSRLVLVGDADQLPPVGPGSVLRDLLASGIVRCVHLDEIFRQAQQSRIVVSAHAVNRGEMPDLNSKTGDFFFLRRRSPADVVDTIVELCRTRLPANMGYAPSQIQVLTPSRKTQSGTAHLNARLQEALNPPSDEKREHRVFDRILREGDRVIQVRNNYDLVWKSDDGTIGMGVFNGDVGVISAISKNAQLLTVRFDERIADYDFSDLDQLELAYALTVHKSQGSEFPVVVMAAALNGSRLLSRNLLYTAITRARELLVMVGYEECVRTMVATNRRYVRYSGLRDRICRLSGRSDV